MIKFSNTGSIIIGIVSPSLYINSGNLLAPVVFKSLGVAFNIASSLTLRDFVFLVRFLFVIFIASLSSSLSWGEGFGSFQGTFVG